jgi:hypothetical protein
MMKADHTTLYFIIKDMENRLRKYISKGNPNPIAVELQNKMISALISVYNYWDRMKHFDAWLRIEEAMAKFETLDNEIAGFTISIRRKPRGKNYAKIEIDLF